MVNDDKLLEGVIVLASDRHAAPVRRVIGEVLAVYLTSDDGPSDWAALRAELRRVAHLPTVRSKQLAPTTNEERQWLVRLAAQIVQHVSEMDAAVDPGAPPSREGDAPAREDAAPSDRHFQDLADRIAAGLEAADALASLAHIRDEEEE